MTLLGSVSLTRPHTSCVPLALPEAWSAPRRRPASRRRSLGWKTRPRTPVLLGPAECATFSISGPRRLWADLQHHAGALRRFLPLRWRTARTTVLVLSPGDTEDTMRRSSEDSFEDMRLSSPSSPPRRSGIRPAGADCDAAAAAMGVDARTYSMLMDLQHRDITPEDYETLQGLDAATTPKTVPRATLQKIAPCWSIAERGGPCKTVDCCDGATCVTPAQDERCCICLELFRGGESVRRLPCRHMFHTRCIDEGLVCHSHICPEDGLSVMRHAA